MLGCLNLLTEDKALAGTNCVRDGKVFALSLNVTEPDPPYFGRPRVEHLVTETPTGQEDELHHWNPQTSSQWDGFRHIKHPIHGYYGGVSDAMHGVHHWAERGLVGRAVLADIARWRESVGRPLAMGSAEPIEADELREVLRYQGTTLEMGDILLIRTGWMAWYRTLTREHRAHLVSAAHTGLRPGREWVEVLWDTHVAAVAADNPGLEMMPPPIVDAGPETNWEDPEVCAALFMHLVLLPLLGLPLGELFDLEDLADECARDGRYTCLFTSAPLHVAGGVASPCNSLAIR